MEHKLRYQHFIVTERPADAVSNEPFSGGRYDTREGMHTLYKIEFGCNQLFLRLSTNEKRWYVQKRPGIFYTDLLVTKNSKGDSTVTSVKYNIDGKDCYYAKFKGPLIQRGEQRIYTEQVLDDDMSKAIGKILIK